MLKWIVIIVLLLGAFWYFQPEKFDETFAPVKGMLGFDKEETPEQTENIIEEEPAPELTPEDEGYCIIDESCVYVAEAQCPEQLYTSKTLCEDALGINETESYNEQSNPNGYNYVGKPIANNIAYDCTSDSDCNHDNTACVNTYCQCDYATGECYLR